MADCFCDIAATFPVLAELGIISASLRSNTEIMLTEEGIALYGATLGDMSMTAYAVEPGLALKCPGRAGISFQWDQRMSCDTGSVETYFIPKGKNRAYIEGDVGGNISLSNKINSYETFSASAGSGPTTPYFRTTHEDGWGFTYSGDPLYVSDQNGYSETSVSFFGFLPGGSKLYLTSFSWECTPPAVPVVSYSFIFVYNS